MLARFPVARKLHYADARALIGARVGDERIVRLPAGEKSDEVMRISYPD